MLSCTEDLRVYLKSERGKGLVDLEGKEEERRMVAREDLRPMHYMAMKICYDVIVSDVPLLFGPGEVGLSALMVANEYVCESSSAGIGEVAEAAESTPKQTKIDIIGYIRSRFQDSSNDDIKIDSTAVESVVERVTRLGTIIRELKEGKHGCGNHNVDMESLKGVHKKLKKCRAWGLDGKKKKKKRKAEE